VIKGLLVDWGGVLTGSVFDPFEEWARADGIDYPHYQGVLAELLGPSAPPLLPSKDDQPNPIHALERGELDNPEFEKLLAKRLRMRDGTAVNHQGMLERMFSQLQHAPDMNALVQRAHSLGIPTALLSNSWGNAYPRTMWNDMFDAVIISGEVGLRKPEPEIYLLAAKRLGLTPQECVFVDDLAINIRGAVSVGMVGVHHKSYEGTLLELESILGVSLSE
jgi:putative hydrolase of the HAD superfamily